MKTAPEADGMKKEFLEENALFDTEIRKYSRVLPEMARMLKEIGEEYKYPRYIYGALEPQVIFIMEDISSQGWEMGGYIESFEDMKPAVKNIAMFHAASVMMEINGANISGEFHVSVDEMYKNFAPLVNKGLGDLLHLTKTWPEFSHFATPLENIQRNVPKMFASFYTPSKSFQNVLIHGDFHSKNLLHQIDPKGRHTETVLLDYQISCWTTPAVHRHELIYPYYQQYADLHKRLGFLGKISTLLDLHIKLLRCAGLEMFHHGVFTAFRYIDPAAIDMEAFVMGKIVTPLVNHPEYKKLMQTELLRLLHLGSL